MAKLTVQAASAQWKVSRTTLYKSFKNGDLSRDSDGKIDASEMRRAYGEPVASTQTEQYDFTPLNTKNVKLIEVEQKCVQLEQLVKTLEKQLLESVEREKFYQRQLDATAQARIDYKPHRGLIGRLFG